MKETFKYLILIISYVIATIYSFPPYNFWFLAWIGTVPLFLLLEYKPLKILMLLIPQFIINLIVLSWLKELDQQLYYLLSGLFAVLSMIPILLSKLANHKDHAYFSPGIFTICEYIRTLGPYGFPFLVIGYTQYKIPYLIQLADLGGVWLISFLIYTVNYLIYKYIKTKQNKYPLIIIIIFVLTIGYGIFFKEIKYNSIKIGLIQPNTNMFLNDWENKEEQYLKLYYDLSAQTLEYSPQLILWPETAIGISLRKSRNTAKKIRTMISELGTDILLGNIDEHLLSLKYKEKYNSAFYIDRTGKVLGEHHKIKLIPFMEIINYQLLLPLNIREKIKSGIYLKGSSTAPLDLPGYRAATVICFEAVFGDYVQKMTKNKANIIYNLSSDGWSTSLAEHQMNFMVNIFRAVENRLYVVRISDTGISGIISPRGNIIASIPAFQQGVLVQTVPLLKNHSFYAKHGDLFIKLLALFYLIYPLVIIFRSKNHP